MTTVDPKVIGKRLRVVRALCGWTLTETHTATAIPIMKWQQYEKGYVPIAPHHLIALARASGISMDWIIAGKRDDMKASTLKKLTAIAMRLYGTSLMTE